MAVLSAGQSVSVSIPIGLSIRLTGSGTAQAIFGTASFGPVMPLGTGPTVLGPYDKAARVDVTAGAQDVFYTQPTNTQGAAQVTRDGGLTDVAGTPISLGGAQTALQTAALAQRNAQAAGAYVLDGLGNLYKPDGSLVVNPADMPTPKNNLIGYLGDSRLANAAELSGELFPKRLTAYAMPAWVQHYSEYRGKTIAIGAVNGAKLNEMLTRLNAAAGNTREDGVIAAGVGILVFLGGVNGANLGSNDDISRFGPLYQSIIKSAVAAGVCVVWCNELPTNSDITSDTNTLAYQNFERRKFIDRFGSFIPASNLVVKANTYDVAAASAGSSRWKAGWIVAGENLHPDLYGDRILAREAIAPIVRAMLIKGGFAPRAVLPITLTDPTFLKVPDLSGTGGGRFTGWTGVTASGWNANSLPAGLTGVASKGVDSNGKPQQILTITGTTAAAKGDVATCDFSNTNLGATGASGDSVYAVAHVIVDAGCTGFVAPSVLIAANDNTNGQYLSAGQFSSFIYNNSGVLNDGWAGEAFDGAVLSQPCVLGSGWTAAASKSVVPSIQLVFLTGVPVNVTVRISDVGIIANV